jgi:hypothetical protein
LLALRKQTDAIPAAERRRQHAETLYLPRICFIGAIPDNRSP